MKKEWRRSGERKASHLNACDCQSEDIKVPHVTHRGDSSVLVKMSSGTTWHLGLYCQNALCVCWKRKERTNFYAPLIRSLCNYPLIYCYLISQQPEEHIHTTLYYFPFPSKLYTNRICIFWHSLFYMTWWRQLYTALSATTTGADVASSSQFSFLFFPFLYFTTITIYTITATSTKRKNTYSYFFLKKPKKKKLTHYNLLLTTYMFI